MSNSSNTRTAHRPIGGKVLGHTTSASVAVTAAISTDIVMVWSDQAAYIDVGQDPTASATTGIIPANHPIFISNVKDQKIAFRSVSSNGTAYVTEMTQ